VAIVISSSGSTHYVGARRASQRLSDVRAPGRVMHFAVQHSRYDRGNGAARRKIG
jgi:hypothetical protein